MSGGYGRFLVNDIGSRPENYEQLEAAQRGCAVVRCEYLYDRRAWELIAWHPDFDASRVTAEYECEFTKGIGGVPVRTFKRCSR